MAVVESGPTQVQKVLAKGSIADPFATLEQARHDPGRLEKIRQIRKQIDERGIKYIFFQQVSVSGHVNGKGVAATQWENVAEAGYQLVYGATADLFVDRNDRYIGFGPEESELAAVAENLETTLATAEPRQAKALLRLLIKDLRVNARSEILPTYRVVTDTVCALPSSVGARGIEPRTSRV